MADRDAKIKMVKANLRSVTQSCKGGVPLERLERDYRDLLGTTIPYRDLGYPSLENMIKDMPDAIALVRNEVGRFNAIGVADEATAHIASLVARQKPSKARKIVRGKPSFHVSSSRGTYSKPFSNYRNRFQSQPWRHPIQRRSLEPQEQIESSRSTSASSQRSDSKSENWPQNAAQKEVPLRKSANAYIAPHKRIPQTQTRSREIPPRFLKQIQIPAPAYEPPIPEPPSPKPGLSSSKPVFHSHEPIIPPPKSLQLNSENYPSNFSGFDEKTVKIPSPKPKSRKRETPPLPSQSSPMEFIAEYAKTHNIQYEFSTSELGQRKKKYIASLKLGNRKFNTYPEDRNTAREAEEYVASLAVDCIIKEEQATKYQEASLETPEDIHIFLQRVEEIVREKPKGIWSIGIPKEYETKYQLSLPCNWLQVLKDYAPSNIDIETPERLHLPKEACILRFINSGTATPTSTSSKTSNPLSDDLGCSMASINSDLCLPEGNEWPVLVTYVASTRSLGVRLIDQSDVFEAMDNEMQAFYAQNRKPFQGTHINKLYAAHQIINNEHHFYRVRLDDVNIDTRKATCYFVDIGETLVLDVSELHELSSQFESLPFQAIPMSLDGLEDFVDFIQLEILDQKLLDKAFIATVKKREDNKVTAVLFDTSGEEDVNVNAMLKEIALKQCLIEPTLPEAGCTTMAQLVHATANGEIYLKLADISQGLLEITMDKHFSKFEAAPPVPVNELSTDKIYVARYIDGLYYRTQMPVSFEINDNEIDMFYIDFGNVSPVAVTEIKDLSAISKLLASWPPQAIPCTLSDVPPPNFSWNESVLLKLYDLAPDNQQLIVKVDKAASETSPAEVGLFTRNEDDTIVSINQTLLFSNLFSPITSNGAVLNATKPSFLPLQLHNTSAEDEVLPLPDNVKFNFMSPSSLWTPTPDGAIDTSCSENTLPPAEIPEIGSYFDVYVTFVASPSNFVVQPLNSSKQLDALLLEMKNFYQAEENQCEMHSVLLKQDNYYAALYEQTWYRAKMKAVDEEEQVTVYFIDFGDFAKVSLHNLQPLYQQFRSLPCQAIKASLYGIIPLYNDWLPENCVETRELLTEKQFVSCVKNIKKLVENNSVEYVLELILVDTMSSPTQDIWIHKQLIEKNVARAAS